MVFCTGLTGCGCVELRRELCALHTVHAVHDAAPHNHSQPQPAQPVQNTICGSTRSRSYSPDDGHNDARNMLRYKFDNKHRISCILLVSLTSPYVHDARSQELKTFFPIHLRNTAVVTYGFLFTADCNLLICGTSLY